MTITTDQPTTDPPTTRPTADVLVDQMEDIIASAKVHADALLEDLRSWGRVMLGARPDPGHGLTSAAQVKRGQQLLYEDGWWHVSDVDVNENGVALHLVRAGHKALSLLVDHDATFETAEIF